MTQAVRIIPKMKECINRVLYYILYILCKICDIYYYMLFNFLIIKSNDSVLF